ncbi:unnamed protein product [Schistocephalus solidus]|uniref:Uncharacterized protein n=1 Tax=Schistocephalus solidus TaxID=70667 RepID=A0A183SYP5_SCHSO|nr:unnamed protein product [Schistocephalus solidus]
MSWKEPASRVSRLRREIHLHWSGHALRMDDEQLPKRIFHGNVNSGASRRGGQEHPYKDVLRTSIKHLQLKTVIWKFLGWDRQLAKRTRQAAYADAIRSLARKGEKLLKLPPLNSSTLASYRAPAEYTNIRQTSLNKDDCNGVPTPPVKPSSKLSPALERCRVTTGTGRNNHAGSNYHAEGNVESEQETKPKSRRALMLEYSKRLREIANRKNKPALPREKNTPPEAPNDNSFVVLDSNILNMLKRHEEENQAVLLVADELKSS